MTSTTRRSKNVGEQVLSRWRISAARPYISVIILMAEKKTLEMPVNIG
jgi:hypothetical protein